MHEVGACLCEILRGCPLIGWLLLRAGLDLNADSTNRKFHCDIHCEVVLTWRELAVSHTRLGEQGAEVHHAKATGCTAFTTADSARDRASDQHCKFGGGATESTRKFTTAVSTHWSPLNTTVCWVPSKVISAASI